MRVFKRGDVADSKFTFLDDQTGEPINVTDAQYRVAYFDGPTEIPMLAWTILPHAVDVGEYIANWEIPLTAPLEKTYYVTARGNHPVDSTFTFLEDFYVVSAGTGGGGGSSHCGMVAKFSKP